MPFRHLRSLARIVSAAQKDAAVARSGSKDPAFLAGMKSDRRTTLRRFETVQHALDDRAAMAAREAKRVRSANAAKATKQIKAVKSAKPVKPVRSAKVAEAAKKKAR